MKSSTSIGIKQGDQLFLVPIHTIHWFKETGGYTTLQTTNGKYTTTTTLEEILRSVSSVEFIRIHKSYVVRETIIQEITDTVVTLKKDTDGECVRFPIGSDYAVTLNEKAAS